MVSGKEVLAIACKLFGLYMLIQSAQLAMGAFSTVLIQPGPEYLTFILIELLARVVMAYYLIRRDDAIVSFILKEKQDTIMQLALPTPHLFQIAFIIAGLFTIVNGLPHVLENIYTWLKLEMMNEYDYDFEPKNTNLFYSSIRVLLGFLIVTNSNNLTKCIAKTNAQATVNAPE